MCVCARVCVAHVKAQQVGRIALPKLLALLHYPKCSAGRKVNVSVSTEVKRRSSVELECCPATFQSFLLIHLFIYLWVFFLSHPKGKQNESEAVLFDDRGERKKSFTATRTVAAAAGCSHCNCLVCCFCFVFCLSCRKEKQQQNPIHQSEREK